MTKNIEIIIPNNIIEHFSIVSEIILELSNDKLLSSKTITNNKSTTIILSNIPSNMKVDVDFIRNIMRDEFGINKNAVKGDKLIIDLGLLPNNKASYYVENNNILQAIILPILTSNKVSTLKIAVKEQSPQLEYNLLYLQEIIKEIYPNTKYNIIKKIYPINKSSIVLVYILNDNKNILSSIRSKLLSFINESFFTPKYFFKNRKFIELQNVMFLFFNKSSSLLEIFKGFMSNDRYGIQNKYKLRIREIGDLGSNILFKIKSDNPLLLNPNNCFCYLFLDITLFLKKKIVKIPTKEISNDNLLPILLSLILGKHIYNVDELIMSETGLRSFIYNSSRSTSTDIVSKMLEEDNFYRFGYMSYIVGSKMSLDTIIEKTKNTDTPKREFTNIVSNRIIDNPTIVFSTYNTLERKFDTSVRSSQSSIFNHVLDLLNVRQVKDNSFIEKVSTIGRLFQILNKSERKKISEFLSNFILSDIEYIPTQEKTRFKMGVLKIPQFNNKVFLICNIENYKYKFYFDSEYNIKYEKLNISDLVKSLTGNTWVKPFIFNKNEINILSLLVNISDYEDIYILSVTGDKIIGLIQYNMEKVYLDGTNKNIITSNNYLDILFSKNNDINTDNMLIFNEQSKDTIEKFMLSNKDLFPNDTKFTKLKTTLNSPSGFYGYENKNNIFKTTIIGIQQRNILRTFSSLTVSLRSNKIQKVDIDFESVIQSVSDNYNNLPIQDKKKALKFASTSNYILFDNNISKFFDYLIEDRNIFIMAYDKIAYKIDDNIFYIPQTEKLKERSKLLNIPINTPTDYWYLSLDKQLEPIMINSKTKQIKNIKWSSLITYISGISKGSDIDNIVRGFKDFTNKPDFTVKRTKEIVKYYLEIKQCDRTSCATGSPLIEFIADDPRVTLLVLFDKSDKPIGRALLWEEKDYILIDSSYVPMRVDMAGINVLREFAWNIAKQKDKDFYVRLGRGGDTDAILYWDNKTIPPLNKVVADANVNFRKELSNVKFNEKIKNAIIKNKEDYMKIISEFRKLYPDADNLKLWLDTFYYANFKNNKLSTYYVNDDYIPIHL